MRKCVEGSGGNRRVITLKYFLKTMWKLTNLETY